MSKRALSLVVALIVSFTVFSRPGVCAAQAREELAEPHGAAVEAEAEAEEEAAPVRETGGARADRIGAEIGFGLGSLVLTTAIGAGIGALANGPCVEGGGWSNFLCGPGAGAIMGGLIGSVVGGALLPAFLTLGGSAVGGRGNIGGAYLGFLVGGASAAGTIALGAVGQAALGGPEGDALLWTTIALGSIMTMTGTIVGYELTHHAATRGPSVTPTLAFDGNGATIGAVGTF